MVSHKNEPIGARMVSDYLITAIIELDQARRQIECDVKQTLDNDSFELPDFLDAILDLLGVVPDTTLEQDQQKPPALYDREDYYSCYVDNFDKEPGHILEALKKLKLKEDLAKTRRAKPRKNPSPK